MNNFSMKKCYPHKNDKIFYELSFKSTKFKLFVTKMFKLVIADNNLSTENIFDFHTFFILLISGISHKNICAKFGIRNLFRIKFERIKFVVLKRNEILFEMSYSKCKMFIKNNLHLIYSYILNCRDLQHIDKKREEIDKYIIENFKPKKQENNFVMFLFNLENKNNFNNCLDIKNKIIIRLLIAYSFFKKFSF